MNFKLFVGVSVFLFFVSWYITKDLFISLFSIFLLTSFFVYPGKNYSFLLIEPGKIAVEPFATTGIIREYGLLASDIAAIAILGFFIRDAVQIFYGKPSKLRSIWRRTAVKIVTICWSIYFFFSLFSSLQFSFNQIFSVINLFQLMKIEVMFLGVVYLLFIYKSSGVKYLCDFISGILIIEFLFGVYQFTTGFFQYTQATSSESYYRSVEEASTLLPRPWGTLSYANEYALFLLLFGLCFLALSQKERQKNKYIILGLTLLSVILSQSRTVLGIIGICSFLLLIFQWRQIKKNLLLKVDKKLMLKVIILFTTAFLFIVLPRIYSLQYTFEGGSASVRIEMISEGLEALQERYLTGFGVYTTEKTIFEYFPKGYLIGFPYAVHLGYLQMALESGVIGTFFFFLPFLLDFRKGVNSYLKHRQHLLVLISSVISGSILVYYVFQPHGGILEVPFLGLFLGISLYNYQLALDV